MTFTSPRGGPFDFIACLAITLLGLIAYGNTFSGGFVWDDASSILLHEHVKDPSKVARLFTEDQHAFAGGQGNFYRPLLSVTFMVDYFVSTLGQPATPPTAVPTDLSPFVFHLSSSLWHVAAALFLMAFLGRVGASSTVRLIVGGIYVLHPLHTEAVAYISGRADSMSATFMFAGLFFSTWANHPPRRVAGIALSSLCFVFALLSKESGLIYPALLGLAGIFGVVAVADDGPKASWVQRYLAFFVSVGVLGVYIALRSTVLNFGSDSTELNLTFAERLVDMLQSFALYIGLIFAPVGLHMERTLEGVPMVTGLIGAALLLGCVAFIFHSYLKNERRAAFGMAWFLVTWLPISGLFPLNAPMAEHWMYVPLAGFLWGLAEFFVPRLLPVEPKPALRTLSRVAAAALCIWAGALLLLTVQRNQDWSSNERLYRATLRESPDSLRVHFNLAVTYDDLLDNPAGARRHYLHVLRLYQEKKLDPELQGQFWTEEIEAHLSLGNIYADQARYSEAYGHYQSILGTQPNETTLPLFGMAAFGAGRCFLAIGDRAGAQQHFESAVQVLPQLRPDIEAYLSGMKTV